MARITLLQRWEELETKIATFKEAQINRFFETNFKPEKLYLCSQIGEIKEFPVIKFNVKYEGVRLPCHYLKRPTTVDVEGLNSYYEEIQNAKPIILVGYKTDYGAEGSEAYDKINGTFAFEPSYLEERAKELKELFAPREGYSPCRYCRKQVPTDSLIEETIIGRGRKTVWNSWKGIYENKACVTKERLKFCSGQCAANEQMSREG
jgi:hypothetical protein